MEVYLAGASRADIPLNPVRQESAEPNPQNQPPPAGHTHPEVLAANDRDSQSSGDSLRSFEALEMGDDLHSIEFPAFFRTLQDVPLCSSAVLSSSSTLRVIPKNTVIFVQKRVMIESTGICWLHLKEGYLAEKLVGADGKTIVRLLVPYGGHSVASSSTQTVPAFVSRHLQDMVAMLPKTVSLTQEEEAQTKIRSKESESVIRIPDVGMTSRTNASHKRDSSHTTMSSEKTIAVAELAAKLDELTLTLSVLQEQLTSSKKMLREMVKSGTQQRVFFLNSLIAV